MDYNKQNYEGKDFEAFKNASDIELKSLQLVHRKINQFKEDRILGILACFFGEPFNLDLLKKICNRNIYQNHEDFCVFGKPVIRFKTIGPDFSIDYMRLPDDYVIKITSEILCKDILGWK